MSIHAHFSDQAGHCERLGSPFMGRLMRLFAERLKGGDPVSDRVLGWAGDPSPFADSVPLRLAGALHALRLDGLALEAVYPPNAVSDDALWSAVAGAMTDHAPRILDWLQSAPQTNEVRRAAAVMPALALLNERFGRPVALFELGCSGGLNLRMDRFHLAAGSAVLGIPGSDVSLTPEWRGSLPVGTMPEIVSRSGVDLNPLDPGDKADRLRLMAYLWPDQPERLALTRAAIAIARENPARIARGDAGSWLETALSQPRGNHLRVVFHTIAWQYFPPETVSRAEAALARAADEATDTAPFARISFESDGGNGASVSLSIWPGATTKVVARADFHGRWVDWQVPYR